LGRVELAPLRRIPVALPRRECVQPDLLAWRGEHPCQLPWLSNSCAAAMPWMR
jgi:hypothetical protein